MKFILFLCGENFVVVAIDNNAFGRFLLHSNPFSVLIAFVVALVNAAGEPDCAALAEENPLKINRYYHPHESDCNLYYQCSRYALVQMQCPEGLHFDRIHNVCARPRDTTCPN